MRKVTEIFNQITEIQKFTSEMNSRSHYGPGLNSASNRNEHQEYFLGVKAADA